ncbi:MAG TPA: sigma-70 family RNA polymerase sigma factor [Acidimicrobiales bacterium]|nr:sigma-70 family RNA polymerase sigma factor [Acidimicrobiales bacterium]
MAQELADLVTAAKAGDQSAFEELVRVTHAAAYTLAFRMTGNEEDAKDVVQEAYLRAWKGLKRFRGDAKFNTWLYRITANCAVTHLSRRTKDRHDALGEEEREADPRAVDTDPGAHLGAGDDRRILQSALQSLSPEMRAVVVLRDIYDLPHEAIAAELGISEGAAKVRLHRARKKLRERLFPLRGELTGEETAHAV